MIPPPSSRSLLISALLIATSISANGHQWRWITPRITSEVIGLQKGEAAALLSEFCIGALKTVKGEGQTCSTRHFSGSVFSDLIDDTFHPEGVIYGHFLSPTSEDAAVSGWNAETHPSLWGGTLLLAGRSGKWTPVWYRSSIMTHSCRKLMMRTGRELLLREGEDAGMGAQVHYIYCVDLTRPIAVRKALLAVAKSFDDGCTVRKQVIDRVTWSQTNQRLTIILSTPEWRYIQTAACAGNFLRREKRPAPVSVSTF